VRALRTLLTGTVDYAGLFPPAGLAMTEAVRRYATYRRGRAAWMLGRFVVPIARLDEFEGAARGLLPVGPGAVPWRLSGLAAGRLSADELRRVAAFNDAHDDDRRGRAVVDWLEVKTPAPDDVAWTASAVAGRSFHVACEVPLAADPAPLVAAVSEGGLAAKFRTGGVTPELIPSSGDLARGIWRASAGDVPFKTTAGLHHPVRGDYALTYEADSARATMHGFLNVFIASAVAARLARARREAGADMGPVPDGLRELLDERDPARLGIEAEAITWRDCRLDLDAIEQARRSTALSFGSCSFEEPLEDLQTLGLVSQR
jgi:hypothetical protein